MTDVKPTFEVDKRGMAQLFARKGVSFVVTELIQNCWDENVTRVDVTLEALENGKSKIVVEDDAPEGFADLAHAYTLFAPSNKKGNAEKRGRFNLGEKLVIAICEAARITTTKGTILFGEKGRRHVPKERRAAGSLFEGVLALTPEQIGEIERTVMTLLPPPGIDTTFNHVPVSRREPVLSFEASLRTEIADEDGRLRPTTRKTVVELFEPVGDEVASVYELGIPVVETGDAWHVNVRQKVPVPLDRDNLPPAYLRRLRVETLNAGWQSMTPGQFKAEWVTNALEDVACSPEAAAAAFRGRFGEKAVVFDPNDSEANKRAAAAGYTVVPGGALPKQAWKQVKGSGVVKPAGQVTPTPDPQAGERELKFVASDHLPAHVREVAEWMAEFGERITDASIRWRVANDPTWPFVASYGPDPSLDSGSLTLNLGKLGYRWFERDDQLLYRVVDLAIHEFAHHFEGDHLDERYYRTLSLLGARATGRALADPGFFERLSVEAVAA